MAKETSNTKIIALAGNPNVGKSTVFNALTGMRQHTGNWPGKTVSNASGIFKYNEREYKIYDLPGIYSILARSEEEFVARDFLCFEKNDCAVVVCDASCLMRNLNLVLQICEITDKVIVCVNLLDEAKKKKIYVDLDKLSELLNVRVVGTTARSNEGLDTLLNAIEEVTSLKEENKSYKVRYSLILETAIKLVENRIGNDTVNKRWIALNLIKDDKKILEKLEQNNIEITESIKEGIINAKKLLMDNNVDIDELDEMIVENINYKAEEIFREVVSFKDKNYNKKDRKLDRIFTSKATGIPVMILLFGFIFWLTIIGSNYPSSILQKFLFGIEDKLYYLFEMIKIPTVINELLIHGIYRVLAWVVSVMLPPMAIFFPLFTILEDLGYLPRIAFNVDGIFKKCRTCGKQALTMAMGFGCNAVGVSGCRIIDSPRERLIAIITNSFIPCNGRFPTLIAIITMFFVGFSNSLTNSFISALLLMGAIGLGIFMSLMMSRILSRTLLRGLPSSFVLELPPYRKPQFGKVIVRSIFDRTLFVLGRAVSIAIPAGFLIWILANVNVCGDSLLNLCSSLLDPIGRLIGLDGVIMLAFILGFPANEIVVPIIIMCYMSTNSLIDISDLSVLKELFVSNGWTFTTAVSFLIFSLMHWPCSTTMLTIKKETNSWKWTILSILIPTVCGFILCFIFNLLVRIFL